MIWEDTSSRSQSDPPDMEPTSWSTDDQGAGVLRRILVHRHIHYPGDWLLSTRPPLVDMHVLEAKDAEAAKLEAWHYLEELVGKLHVCLTR